MCPQGKTALCQFKDNILIATSFPDSPQIRVVERVCRILESCWDVAMLCDCCQQQSDPCTYACHGRSCVALGYCLVRGEHGNGAVFVQPSALDQHWCLKLGPPLITPSHTHPAYLPGILLGVLSNAQQWCGSWAGELLSLAAWLQIASLSSFSVKQITRAAHSAVVQGLSTSPHECAKSVRFLYDIVHYLPTVKCCAIKFCLHWLKINGQWRGNQYSSWTIPDSLSPNGVTGAGSDDWHILHHEP